MRIAGLGFRDSATLPSLRAALGLVEAAGGPATALATLPAKAEVAVLRQLAEERGLAVLAVPVRGIATPTHSARVMALHGTGSMAEAAALAAAGPGAILTVARISAPDGMATCAMATHKGTQP
ncbi:cobalamin biosynthesis protein [Rhodobacteraceae bacterium HSP-20]|uniref:Cobalamin biosynthesis protein n=1 Tax=Paragemmobacter amnigenus TaxID=2852097 RepID=A0ABS6J5D7_9RHOB|nr:cobalamin biosynthesis protein [Rhodobacter amnigenus]MBU9698964.1 cobalamin biosynthesis protein [Rhodobacter amnigenus]MBV4390191.1 cobalamin biosynthesis protein [Rhodobacter amnigenus]